MRRIAIINQKGGVGKTTTAVNLAGALCEAGRRVLVVDMDPQANLTLHLDHEIATGEPSTYTVLHGQHTLAQAVRETTTPGLRLVGSNLDLSGAELELAAAIGREKLLLEAIDAWEEETRDEAGRPAADYVILDCPPSLGLLGINALAAVSEVLITIQTEFLALQGMSKLVEVVQLLRKRLNPELTVGGILPSLYDSRLRLAREVLGEIRNYFPGQVFPSPVRTNVKLAEASSFGQTIFQYAPESKGAEDYRAAAYEVMLQEEERDPSLAHLPAPQDPRERGRRPAVRPSAATPVPAREETPAEEPAAPAPEETASSAVPAASSEDASPVSASVPAPVPVPAPAHDHDPAPGEAPTARPATEAPKPAPAHDEEAPAAVPPETPDPGRAGGAPAAPLAPRAERDWPEDELDVVTLTPQPAPRSEDDLEPPEPAAGSAPTEDPARSERSVLRAEDLPQLPPGSHGPR